MNKFRNILFVADHSKGERAALARILAVAQQTGARVTVMDVHSLFPQDLQDASGAFDIYELQQELKKEARERIERLLQSCTRSAPLPAVVIREGIGYIEIIREVHAGRHDLLAKAAATDAGLADLLFGTLDMQLLRNCPCPVFIIKPRKKIAHARVLVALDIDDHGRKGNAFQDTILDHAAAVAGFEEGSLDLLHVWELPYQNDMRNLEKIRKIKAVDAILRTTQKRKQHRMSTLARRWEALEPRTHLVKGLPELVIPRFTRDHRIDLVVMGTVGRTGIKGFFMGNTAEKILRSISCSVLAIKPKGFKSPVR